MSNLFISHYSALKFYKTIRGDWRKERNIMASKTCPHAKDSVNIDKDDVKAIIDALGLEKLDLIFSRNDTRPRNKIIKVHTYTKTFPTKSFLQSSISNIQIFITSPELLFYQMANNLSFAELFQLGLELCGCYNSNSLNTDYNVSPLTSPQKILNFGERLKTKNKYMKSINKALRIAKMLVPYSASPQESKLFILLTTPHCYGGYGLKNFKFNVKIQLSTQAKRIARQNFIFVDICNENNKIAIEYDSEQFHDNSGQNIRDKRRTDALNYDG